jgi:hypothetical protein
MASASPVKLGMRRLTLFAGKSGGSPLAKAAEAKQMSAIVIVFLTIIGDFLRDNPIEASNSESVDSELCRNYLIFVSPFFRK